MQSGATVVFSYERGGKLVGERGRVREHIKVEGAAANTHIKTTREREEACITIG
jgi:hypothetical protein